MSNFRVINWNDLHLTEKEFFEQGSAISVGGFDGIHLGHIALLKKVLRQAEEKALKPGIITFSQPPAAGSAFYAGSVYSLRLKLKEVEELGFEFVVLIDFSSDFAKISGAVFFDVLLLNINMKYLAAGQDFRYGFGRSSDVENIRRLAEKRNFDFEVISPVHSEKCLRVSSTDIRNAVFSGNFVLAEKLLGKPFIWDMHGIKFEKNGKKSFRAQSADITQVRPPAGRYSVFAVMTDGTKLKAELTLSGEYAEFCLDKNENSGINDNFEIIQFINKE